MLIFYYLILLTSLRSSAREAGSTAFFLLEMPGISEAITLMSHSRISIRVVPERLLRGMSQSRNLVRCLLFCGAWSCISNLMKWSLGVNVLLQVETALQRPREGGLEIQI